MYKSLSVALCLLLPHPDPEGFRVHVYVQATTAAAVQTQGVFAILGCCMSGVQVSVQARTLDGVLPFSVISENWLG